MRRWGVAGLLGLALAGAAGPARAAPAGRCTLDQLLELKVTMDGMKAMAAVGINGHDERFAVDSGAAFSTISSGKAAELGLRLEPLPPNFHFGGIGGEVTPHLATVKAMELVGVPLHDVRFIVAPGEVARGAGLLGQNVLGIGDDEYDLAHGAVRILRPKGCRDAGLAYWAKGRSVSTVVLEPRDAGNPHTVGAVTIDGVKLRAIFDTGAGGTVLSLAAARRLGITPDSPGVKRDGFGYGIGRRMIPSYLVPISSIAIGDGETVKNTHLRVEDISLGDGDLLLGADFFLSHRVYVANGLHRLFFTYDGGPVFNAVPGAHLDQAGASVAAGPDSAAEPTDAAGWARRGAAFVARRDFPHAIADLDRAVALAPTEPRYLVQRAQAHGLNRESLAAADDLDAALKLAPDDAEARLLRAGVRLGRHDRAAALDDVATVDRGAAPAADVRLQLAGMYERMDEPARAAGQYDLWLRYHPEDARRAGAQGGRCWARATVGDDLKGALADCDAALKARPGAIGWLAARALVRLKQGDPGRAVADCDAALALQPRLALPLFVRGVAERRLGQAAAAQRDLAAAAAIEPRIAERAKRYGLTS